MFSQKLQENCLLVQVRVSKWSGIRSDRRASELIDEKMSARNAGSYYKHLIPRSALSRINGIEVSLREFVHNNTIPWNEHQRILPADLVVDFMEKVRDYQDMFDREVKRFLDKYDKIIDEAKTRLGGLFNESEYPTKEALQAHFSMKVTLLPFPEVSDNFMVGIGDEIIDQIKKDLEEEYKTVQNKGKEILINKFLNLAEKLAHSERMQMRSIDKLKATIDIVLGYSSVYDLGKISEILLDIKKTNVLDDQQSKEAFRNKLNSAIFEIQKIMGQSES